MNKINIICKCYECREVTDIDLPDYDFICEECKTSEKNNLQLEIFKSIIDDINDTTGNLLKSGSICGFTTESEKECFLRGFMYGKKDALSDISSVAEDYGFLFWDETEKIIDKWKDIKINSDLIAEDFEIKEAQE